MTMTLWRVFFVFSLFVACIKATQEYTSLGCWKDTANRAIPTLESKCGHLDGWWMRRANKMQKCVRCAKEMGIKIFALQASGWCAGTTVNGEGYKKYGPANNCPADGLGGGWANNVYRLGPPPLQVNLGASDIYCNKRTRDCSYLNFVVASIGSASAECHFKRMEGGLGEKWKEDPNYKDRLYDAVLDGDTKAKCRIPKTDAKFASFKLVLKNDKGQEGNFGQIFIYDSECVACTNGKCSHVAGTCLIKNRCFKQGESHPIDSCKLCRTEVSKTAFSFPDQKIPDKVPEVNCGPPARQDANYGKNCPGGHNSCINNNQGISTVAQAWEQCGKVAQCAFVMRYVNNLYYLRRATDPNLVYPGIWGYNYKKCQKPKPPPPVTTTSCVNYGACSYMPVDVAVLIGAVGDQADNSNIHVQMSFLELMISNFKISKSGIHFGVYTYGINDQGDQNKQVIDFSATTTDAMVSEVKKISHDMFKVHGKATISKGIEKVKLDFLLGKTGRQSQKVVIILAGEPDSDGLEKLKDATKYFKETGTKIIAVNTNAPGFPDLQEVASDGGYLNNYLFKDTTGTVKAVSQKLCKSIDVHEFPPFEKPVVVAEAHEGQTRFKCDYKPKMNTQDTIYEVMWYRGEDDSLIKSHADTVTKEEGNIIFGNEIYCSVVSYFSFSPETKSDKQASDLFFMGIQLKTKPGEHKLTLTDSDPPTVIQVESSVPIICSAEKQCPIEVAIVQPDSRLLLSKCQIQFPCNHRAGSNDHVTAVVKRDVVNTGSKDIELSFEFTYEGCSPEWKNYGESMVSKEDEPVSHELSDELSSDMLNDEPQYDESSEKLNDADDELEDDEMSYQDELMNEDELMDEPEKMEEASEEISKRQRSRRRRRGRGGSTTITTVTRPGGESSAQGDPHFTSYDGLYINLYTAGDFIYAMNPKRDFMVQARVKGIVNCAVAAKEGRDVVVIDSCHGAPKVQFASKALPNPNTVVSKLPGNLYQIRFPSGAVIKFKHNGWYNDINIFPVPEDFGNLVGIQGSWDGNRNNDNLMRDGKSSGSSGNINAALANSWRPKDSENLFLYDGGELKCDLPKESKRKWCTCGQDEEGNAKNTCDVMSFFLDPPYAREQGQIFESEAVKECEKQIKENAKIADDRTDEDREIVDFEDRENINTKWPTPTGKTEAQVQKLCEDKIKNSALGKECARILGDKFNFDNLIKGCKEDIRIMDDVRFADGYHASMAQQCKDDISKMTEDKKEEPKQGFCPNECSGHGTCANSKCTCHTGYMGNDCSRKTDEKMEITKYAPNVCDVRERRCWRVEVHGKGFYEEDDLKADYTMTKVVLGKSFDEASSVIKNSHSDVDVRNKLLAYYQLPYEHTATDNHLSGAGAVMYTAKFSSEKTGVTVHHDKEYIVFDGKCVECDMDARECDLKMDTCLVDGKCYTSADGDKCKKVVPIDKGMTFCRRYKPYCSHIKNGGAHKAYMEQNCADSCKKLLSENPVDKGLAACKPYKKYCKQITAGGSHQAWMKKNCAQSCKKLLNEQPTDKGLAVCKPYKKYCKQITAGGSHQVWMKKNCAQSCKKLLNQKPTDKGMKFCKRYKRFCTHIAAGGAHQAYMKANCAKSCKKLMVKPKCVDRIKHCQQHKRFCAHIKNNGAHKKYMQHNCCKYCAAMNG